ncbi:extracellular solute-binding protein [Lachnospiraceae bacterium 29-91]
MRFKKVNALFMAAALIGSTVAGCAKAETEEPKGSEDIEISFWHHMEGTNAEALETVCSNFNETLGKEYGIKVTPSFQGTNTAEKLNTLAQAGDWGNYPDLCQVASAGIPAISEYEIFVSPEDMYEKGEDIILERDSIIENNARTFTYQDELCAMPFSNSTILLYYNKDLLDEAGLDPETAFVTIEDMAESIKKLTQKNGDEVTTYGLNTQVKRYQLVNWVGGQGDFNFIGDHEGGRADMMTKFTFGEDGTLMNFLNEWEKVINTGGYKAIEDNINEEFAMEISAMAIMSSARIMKLEGLIGNSFEWGTAPLPKVSEDDKGGTAVGGSGVVMFDKGDEEELRAAWIFQQYLGGEDAQYDFCTASGYIPMNKDLYETEKMKSYMEENQPIVAAVDQLMNSNPNVQEPFDIVTGDVNTIIDEEMAAFAGGKQDKQTTHDNIVEKCNAKISEYVGVNQ